MKKVEMRPLHHRGEERIAIVFEQDGRINGLLRRFTAAKWSKTHRCWHIPLEESSFKNVMKQLEAVAQVDVHLLRFYLQKRRTESKVSDVQKKSPKSKDAGGSTFPGRKSPRKPEFIHPVNQHILPALKRLLELKAYSPATIRTYMNEVSAFLKTLGHHSADAMPTTRIRDYLHYCAVKLRLTENTLHSRINALKFYYEKVLGRERFFWEIPRPKKAGLLPSVLSKEEMVLLIRAIDNIKHRTMIMLGYACGLRVSEIIRLQLRDIDEDRRLIWVRRGKGKKDRIVSLSPAMLVMLREYRKQYQPERFVFEGRQPGTAYSIRSLEMIVSRAKEKAGIRKPGNMHMLRHSFATHLIEKGTDISFIQKLLGHNDVRTTMRYLHVTNKDLLNILSPLEDIKDLL